MGNYRSLTRNDVEIGIGGAIINFKREVGDFNTLANPRIRAKNKEKARVLIGDKVPVITATTGTGGFVSDSVNYLDVGSESSTSSPPCTPTTRWRSAWPWR